MNDTYLLKGSIARGIALFALPVLFSQLFQTLYNTADTVLVGYFLGENSLAAMGAVAALFELIVGFCNGCGNGFAIIAGQKYGAGDKKGLRKTVAMAFCLSLSIGVLLSVFFTFFVPVLLHWLNTAPEVYTDSLHYIQIIIAGLLITIFYNFEAGMLRAIGDSVTPLIFLALSALLNIGLDYVMILGFGLGVAGTAYATLISQGICSLLCLVWILKGRRMLVPLKEDRQFDKPLVIALLEQGLAMGLMSSIVSVGTVILQSAINQMDLNIQAAHAAVRKMMSIFVLIPGALFTALSAFTAQNTGAGQFERIVKGIRLGNQFAIVYSMMLTGFAMFFSEAVVQLFSGSSQPEVIANGAMYLKINLPFYFALCILCNLRSCLQALGEKTVPVISSVIELTGKLLFTWLVIPHTGYVGVCWSEPVIWVLMMLYLGYNYKRAGCLQGYEPRVL